MKILAIDTETDGLPPKNKSFSELQLDDMPHMASLGAVLFDTEFSMVATYHSLFKGVEIPKTKFFIKEGMSTERQEEYGVAVDDGLRQLVSLANRADFLVAHNMEFDWGCIVDSAFRRAHWSDGRLTTMPKYCTMLTLQPHLKIPDKYIPGEYKTPGLQESYKRMINPSGFKGAHNALTDAWACAKLFIKCVKEDVKPIEWKQPLR